MSLRNHYKGPHYRSKLPGARQFGMQALSLTVSKRSDLWRQAAAQDEAIHQLGEKVAGDMEIDLSAIESAASQGNPCAIVISEVLGRLSLVETELEQAS